MPLNTLRLAAILLLSTLIIGCTGTSKSVRPAALGQPSSSAALREQLGKPGIIEFSKHLAARWEINRSGLINLNHPAAKQAGLTDDLEPIEIYFYRITHPTFGTYIIDSGIAQSFGNPNDIPEVSWIINKAMNTPALDTRLTTGDWLEQTNIELSGVFLTHLHLDHIFGMPDIPAEVPVFTGPGETGVRSFENLFSRGTTDRLLGDVEALREWQFTTDPDGELAGVIDVFADGSLWAIHVPGHTPGSTAFVVQTKDGPHLIVGDASHTAWGWENNVEPGEFSVDQPRSRQSLSALKNLVADFMQLQVHPGHQSLDGH